MILVIGRTGQVGRALQKVLANRSAMFWGREEADLSQPDALRDRLESLNVPLEAVMIAAAYTAVDKAESEEAVADAVNAESVDVLARFARSHDIPLVHYSTDYVFDGSGDAPRTEDAPTAPLGAYGRSKLKGEQAIEEVGGKYLIFRTSWVYDAEGQNFLNTMLRLGAQRESLNIVGDQIGAPSFAKHLAQAAVDCLDKARAMDEFPSGVYHLCNGGETSWHGFATEIFAQARTKGQELAIQEVGAIPSSDYPTPAARPLNSRLDCSKLKEVFDVSLPSWEEALKECIAEKF